MEKVIIMEYHSIHCPVPGTYSLRPGGLCRFVLEAVASPVHG